MMTLHTVARPLALLSLSLLACGCLEIDITTHVNRDGTLLRSETVSGDSAEVMTHGFISPVDSTWRVTFDAKNERTFERKAARLFAGPDELSAATLDTLARTLPVRARIERRFIWFYTEITYSERYLKWNPFGLIPLAEYLSTEDLARSMSFATTGRVMNREDSLAQERMGEKWTEWMYRDMFEAYFAELNKGVNALNDPSLSPAAVAGHKEEIYKRCRMWWASPSSMDTIAIVIQSIMKTPAVRGAMKSNSRGFDVHRAKLGFVSRVTGKLKQVNIEMPGTIIDSNAPNVDKNRGSWKGVPEMSYAGDFEIWMTSHVVNWWVVLLTAVVIIGGIGLIFTPSARRAT